MTNKPKAPQNNTGKLPTSITTHTHTHTQAAALSAKHIIIPVQGLVIVISFQRMPNPKHTLALTHDLELTRDAGEALRGLFQ